MTVEITVVVNTEDGGTSLSKELIEFRTSANDTAQNAMRRSQNFDCRRYGFVELPTGYSSKIDFASRKFICVVLSGQVEVKTSDDLPVQLGPGEVLTVKDTEYEAPSRSTTVLSDEPVRALIIELN